jgi:hypothetical protein
MKVLIAMFCLMTISICVRSQSIEQLIEFQLNQEDALNSDDIQIFDAANDKVILVVRSNDFSTNSGITFENSSADGVLLLCNSNMDLIWSKAYSSAAIYDAIIGQDGVYIYCIGNELVFLENEYEASSTSSVAKLSFDGEFVWAKSYGGLARFQIPHRSLAMDSNENLILATGLINYDHGSAIDSLFFNGDTCHCIAQDLDFPYCLSTLKWDQDGNELSVHVLNSISPSYATDVGTDAYGNYYVSATSDFSLEPPVFAGYEIDSGSFVLKFGLDNSEQWVYHRSDQLETSNSGFMYFLKADNEFLYLHVAHDTNEIVTNGSTITLDQPIEEALLSYLTIHIVDQISGDLEMLDFFGHGFPNAPLAVKESQGVCQVTQLSSEFEHSFPPFSYTPSDNQWIILSKQIQGAYHEPLVLEGENLQIFDYIASNKLYCDINNNQEVISFDFNGQNYQTQTKNCIVIFDSVSNIEGTSRESNDVSVFPNPVDDQPIHIQSPFPIHHVSILNQQGIKVQSIQGFNKLTIDEELKLSSGLYFLLIYGDDQREVKRLIVH